MYPEIQLGPLGTIPTYIVFLSLLYSGLLFYISKRAQKRNLSDSSIQPKIALDLALLIMLGGFLGARVLHVFFEEPAYYAQDWSRVLAIWQGGFVFYGGFIGAVICSLIYLFIKKENIGRWFDFYAPVLALGYGLGRISCLLAGCCYGKYCELPWAMTFAFDSTPRHPTQIYAVLFELFLFAILVLIERKKLLVKKSPGILFFLWLSGHSYGRLMMEYFRDDFRGPQVLGLSISVWISLVLMSLSLTALPLLASRKSES